MLLTALIALLAISVHGAKFSYVCESSRCQFQFEVDERLARHVDTSLLSSFVDSLNSAVSQVDAGLRDVETMRTAWVDVSERSQ
jgi:hypothetical protein